MNQTKENLKKISGLAIPLILSQIGQVFVTLADNAMVGHAGKEYLAASSFANSVFMMILMFGMGITFGLTPLVGKSYGQKEYGYIQKLFHNSIFLNLMISVILMIVGVVVGLCMPFMGQPEHVVALAQPYYYILLISVLPLLHFFSIKQFAEGMENTKLAMILTVTGNILNIIGNYILIYGKFGAPQLYLNGAGISTLISRIFMMVGFIYVFKTKSVFENFSLSFSFKEIEWKIQKRLLGIGSSIGLQMLIEAVIFSVGAIMMGWVGELYLASHQIAVSLSYFTFMIANGIAQATTIRISTLYGQKDLLQLNTTIKLSFIITLCYSTLCCIMFYVLARPLAAIFTNETEVIAEAAALIGMAAIYQIFDGLQVLGIGVLRGFADVKRPMIYAAASYLLVGIPGGYICTFTLGMGARGIWVGFIIGLGSAAVLFWARTYKRMKVLGGQLA